MPEFPIVSSASGVWDASCTYGGVGGVTLILVKSVPSALYFVVSDVANPGMFPWSVQPVQRGGVESLPVIV
jgi:hypothetical protein